MYTACTLYLCFAVSVAEKTRPLTAAIEYLWNCVTESHFCQANVHVLLLLVTQLLVITNMYSVYMYSVYMYM